MDADAIGRLTIEDRRPPCGTFSSSDANSHVYMVVSRRERLERERENETGTGAFCFRLGWGRMTCGEPPVVVRAALASRRGKQIVAAALAGCEYMMLRGARGGHENRTDSWAFRTQPTLADGQVGPHGGFFSFSDELAKFRKTFCRRISIEKSQLLARWLVSLA